MNISLLNMVKDEEILKYLADVQVLGKDTICLQWLLGDLRLGLSPSSNSEIFYKSVVSHEIIKFSGKRNIQFTYLFFKEHLENYKHFYRNGLFCDYVDERSERIMYRTIAGSYSKVAQNVSVSNLRFYAVEGHEYKFAYEVCLTK